MVMKLKKELCKDMKASKLWIPGVLVLLVLLSIPVGCTYQDIRVTPSQITQSQDDDIGNLVFMADRTVLVQADGGLGSGVVFGKNLVLTAAHVVSHREVIPDEQGNPSLGPLVIETAAVLKNHGSDAYLSQVKVVKIDEDLDLAILKLDLEYPYGIAIFASSDPKLYQKCWVSGHPHGLTDPIVTEGRVQDLWADGFMMYSAPTTFGNSGGPVWILEMGAPSVTSIVQRVVVEGFGVAVNHLGFGALPEAVRNYVK